MAVTGEDVRRAILGWPRCRQPVDGGACGRWIDPTTGSPTGPFGDQTKKWFRCEGQQGHIYLSSASERQVMGLE